MDDLLDHPDDALLLRSPIISGPFRPMESTDAYLRWSENHGKSLANLMPEQTTIFDGTPASLCTDSLIRDAGFGTGHAIYQSSILPAIQAARYEVILVTCFWARSQTLDDLNDALCQLSARATRSGLRIRVRICFSSSSLFQKLFHSQSLRGQTYASRHWTKQLGLASADQLSGLDLEIKSLFLLPFSVMHPKFVVIDRETVLLPSCNVSWENWYEGCLRLQGPVVLLFLRFWRDVWTRASNRPLDLPDMPARSPNHDVSAEGLEPYLNDGVQTIFLPSTHQRNPRFALPWQEYRDPPATRRNMFLLAAFKEAKSKIVVRSPNLTAPPVLTAIFAALKRGVDVRVITNDGLMILEQLCTAGSTTRRCVKILIKRYRRIVRQLALTEPVALESGGRRSVGNLQVYFYRPVYKVAVNDEIPIQSHLKLTIIDDEWVIFGSGNMDRASWYTSQELDVAFFSRSLALQLDERAGQMEAAIQCLYDSQLHH